MLGLTDEQSTRPFASSTERPVPRARIEPVRRRVPRIEYDDERLRALPLIGGIDQWVDSADVLSELRMFSRSLGRAYDVLA